MLGVVFLGSCSARGIVGNVGDVLLGILGSISDGISRKFAEVFWMEKTSRRCRTNFSAHDTLKNVKVSPETKDKRGKLMFFPALDAHRLCIYGQVH